MQFCMLKSHSNIHACMHVIGKGGRAYSLVVYKFLLKMGRDRYRMPDKWYVSMDTFPDIEN